MPRANAYRRIRTLAFDEQAAVRAGLAVLLEESEIKVHASGSWAEFCRELGRPQPYDVVCLEPNLQGQRDLGLIGQALKAQPEARILIYSSVEEISFVAATYEAGARGFVSKRAEPGQLLKGLREVSRGEVHYTPQFAAQLAHYHTSQQQLNPRNVLTDRELEIFIGLAMGEGKSSIAKALGISLKSIQNRAMTVRLKLGVPREHFERVALFYGLIEPEWSSPRILRRVAR